MNPDILGNMGLSTHLQRAIRERIPLIGNLWQGVPMVDDIPMEDEILAVERDKNTSNRHTNDHIQRSESPSAIRAMSHRDEWCETFLSGADLSGAKDETSGAWRLERIVSFGNASPPGFWYDQTEHEWVVLLTGSAVLRFDTPNSQRNHILRPNATGSTSETDVSEKTEGNESWSYTLRPSDWLWIPAHVRHRIDSTATDVPTLWLAFFCK